MKREFLKELGIEKEDIDKIMSEHGKTIETLKAEKSTLDTEKTTLTGKITELNTTITDRDTQLEDLKKSSGNKEELEGKIATMQTDNATALAEAKKTSDDTIAALQLDNALNVELTGAKVKNIKAVKPLLDLTKVKLDGTLLLGVSEQITALRESDSYLFGEAGDTGGGGNPPNADDASKDGELSDVALSGVWGGEPPTAK